MPCVASVGSLNRLVQGVEAITQNKGAVITVVVVNAVMGRSRVGRGPI